MNEQLVEKVARAIITGMNHPEGPDTPVSGFINGEWKPLGPLWKVEFSEAARAAVALVGKECAKLIAALSKENRDEAIMRAEKQDFVSANHFNACADGCDESAAAILALGEKK